MTAPLRPRIASPDKKCLGSDHAAYVDAVSSMAKLDPPEVYARYIPASFVTALVNEHQVREGWRIPFDTHPEVVSELRRWGMTDIRDPLLTAYAIKVRRAILDGRD